jgi:hypothetical protein
LNPFFRFKTFGLVEAPLGKSFVVSRPMTRLEGRTVRRAPYEQQRRTLVERHQRIGYVSSVEVSEAMLAVPRELFVSDSTLHAAYADHPLDIGYGQTISAPHMVAIMVEAMQARPC